MNARSERLTQRQLSGGPYSKLEKVCDEIRRTAFELLGTGLFPTLGELIPSELKLQNPKAHRAFLLTHLELRALDSTQPENGISLGQFEAGESPTVTIRIPEVLRRTLRSLPDLPPYGVLARAFKDTITHELRHAADWAYKEAAQPGSFAQGNPPFGPSQGEYANSPIELIPLAGNVAQGIYNQVGEGWRELSGTELLGMAQGTWLDDIQEENRPTFLQRVVKGLEQLSADNARRVAKLELTAAPDKPRKTPEFTVHSDRVVETHNYEAAYYLYGEGAAELDDDPFWTTPWCGNRSRNLYRNYGGGGKRRFLVMPDGPDATVELEGQTVPVAKNVYTVSVGTDGEIKNINDCENRYSHEAGWSHEGAQAAIDVLDEDVPDLTVTGTGANWEDIDFAEEWADAGFTPDEAREWMQHPAWSDVDESWTPRHVRPVLQRLNEYDSRDFTVEEAAEWWRSGIGGTEAYHIQQNHGPLWDGELIGQWMVEENNTWANVDRYAAWANVGLTPEDLRLYGWHTNRSNLFGYEEEAQVAAWMKQNNVTEEPLAGFFRWAINDWKRRTKWYLKNQNSPTLEEDWELVESLNPGESPHAFLSLWDHLETQGHTREDGYRSVAELAAEFGVSPRPPYAPLEQEMTEQQNPGLARSAGKHCSVRDFEDEDLENLLELSGECDGDIGPWDNNDPQDYINAISMYADAFRDATDKAINSWLDAFWSAPGQWAQWKQQVYDDITVFFEADSKGLWYTFLDAVGHGTGLWDKIPDILDQTIPRQERWDLGKNVSEWMNKDSEVSSKAHDLENETHGLASTYCSPYPPGSKWKVTKMIPDEDGNVRVPAGATIEYDYSESGYDTHYFDYDGSLGGQSGRFELTDDDIDDKLEEVEESKTSGFEIGDFWRYTGWSSPNAPKPGNGLSPGKLVEVVGFDSYGTGERNIVVLKMPDGTERKMTPAYIDDHFMKIDLAHPWIRAGAVLKYKGGYGDPIFKSVDVSSEITVTRRQVKDGGAADLVFFTRPDGQEQKAKLELIAKAFTSSNTPASPDEDEEDGVPYPDADNLFDMFMGPDTGEDPQAMYWAAVDAMAQSYFGGIGTTMDPNIQSVIDNLTPEQKAQFDQDVFQRRNDIYNEMITQRGPMNARQKKLNARQAQSAEVGNPETSDSPDLDLPPHCPGQYKIHYVDNQGRCHSCGALMDSDLWEQYTGQPLSPEEQAYHDQQVAEYSRFWAQERGKRKSAAFMVPEYDQDDFYGVETNDGYELVPGHWLNGVPKTNQDIDDAAVLEGDPVDPTAAPEVHKGKIFTRLTAPGYMDKTDWNGPYDTMDEARKHWWVEEQLDPDSGDDWESLDAERQKELDAEFGVTPEMVDSQGDIDPNQRHRKLLEAEQAGRMDRDNGRANNAKNLYPYDRLLQKAYDQGYGSRYTQARVAHQTVALWDIDVRFPADLSDWADNAKDDIEIDCEEPENGWDLSEMDDRAEEICDVLEATLGTFCDTVSHPQGDQKAFEEMCEDGRVWDAVVNDIHVQEEDRTSKLFRPFFNTQDLDKLLETLCLPGTTELNEAVEAFEKETTNTARTQCTLTVYGLIRGQDSGGDVDYVYESQRQADQDASNNSMYQYEGYIIVEGEISVEDWEEAQGDSSQLASEVSWGDVVEEEEPNLDDGFPDYYTGGEGEDLYILEGEEDDTASDAWHAYKKLTYWEQKQNPNQKTDFGFFRTRGEAAQALLDNLGPNWNAIIWSEDNGSSYAWTRDSELEEWAKEDRSVREVDDPGASQTTFPGFGVDEEPTERKDTPEIGDLVITTHDDPDTVETFETPQTQMYSVETYGEWPLGDFSSLDAAFGGIVEWALEEGYAYSQLPEIWLKETDRWEVVQLPPELQEELQTSSGFGGGGDLPAAQFPAQAPSMGGQDVMDSLADYYATADTQGLGWRALSPEEQEFLDNMDAQTQQQFHELVTQRRWDQSTALNTQMGPQWKQSQLDAEPGWGIFNEPMEDDDGNWWVEIQKDDEFDVYEFDEDAAQANFDTVKTDDDGVWARNPKTPVAKEMCERFERAFDLPPGSLSSGGSPAQEQDPRLLDPKDCPICSMFPGHARTHRTASCEFCGRTAQDLFSECIEVTADDLHGVLMAECGLEERR